MKLEDFGPPYTVEIYGKVELLVPTTKKHDFGDYALIRNHGYRSHAVEMDFNPVEEQGLPVSLFASVHDGELYAALSGSIGTRGNVGTNDGTILIENLWSKVREGSARKYKISCSSEEAQRRIEQVQNDPQNTTLRTVVNTLRGK